MDSYHCMRCGNNEDFFPTPIGTCCSSCLSYEVQMDGVFPPAEVYIPPTDKAQTDELLRIFNLPDVRVGAF